MTAEFDQDDVEGTTSDETNDARTMEEYNTRHEDSDGSVEDQNEYVNILKQVVNI